VVVDHRAEFDLLDLDDLLLLAGFGLLFLLLESVFAVVQILQIGGTALGEISTRSRPASRALARASAIGMVPRLAPSLSIR
jgi:hypothetical protein